MSLFPNALQRQRFTGLCVPHLHTYRNEKKDMRSLAKVVFLICMISCCQV